MDSVNSVVDAVVLCSCWRQWTRAVDEGLPIDIIYMDFKKAFDSVPHRRLIAKLHAYGFRGELLQWLTDFLRDRKQRVRIGDSFSHWIDILSGVPQGSFREAYWVQYCS